MRPQRLEFEGFGPFKDRTLVDFAGADLVGFVGPTGSGKSTVIDALTFALYGSVARYNDTRLVAPVIHQLSTEAKVRFEFELGGQAYIAMRVVRRTKSKAGSAPRATTREARLERIEGDGSTTVLAGNVKELDEVVENLIGLDFAQFTRTIVLPQGEFAEFLKEDPGSRQRLLRQLLDIDIYARMGTVARERASQIGHQLEVYRHELERLADVGPADATAAAEIAERLQAFGATLGGELDRVDSIEKELVTRRDEVNDLDRRLGLLAAVELDAAAGAVDDAITAERQRVLEVESALELARTTRSTASQALDEMGEASIWQKRYDARQRLDEIEAELGSLQAQVGTATAEELAATTAAAEAEAALDHAAAALSAARTAADAASWVERLSVGEPCPVCQQTVAQLPDHLEASGHEGRGGQSTLLTGLEEAEESARAEARRTATRSARAEGSRVSLEADLAQREKVRTELVDRFIDLEDLAPLQAILDRAAAAAKAERSAAAALAETEAAASQARDRLVRAEAAEGIFRAQFQSQRDTVAELAPPVVVGQGLIEDWQALVEWVSVVEVDLRKHRSGVAATGKELAASKADLIDGLSRAANALGLDGEPDGLLAATASATATAVAELARIEDRLARKAELAQTVATLAENEAVFDSMGQHLAANGFERWLLTTALEEIVARSTVLLLELSNNRYSLEAVDGSFAVRDHGNADERRDIRTLSGGEVFLASLALALALAESIAELAPVDSPRLESIFLDEGFGTLDGETLDILASAIEELSASGRMVAVVTHVRDLADRLPTRFEVSKGSTTSAIERVDQ